MQRTILALLLTMLSISTSTAQAPTMIREVAKHLRTTTEGGKTVAQYEYKGVYVVGEVSLKDFNDATGVVRAQLQTRETILTVYASQQVPGREAFGDMVVHTCSGDCNVPRGGSGRTFAFGRVDDELRLDRIGHWMS